MVAGPRRPGHSLPELMVAVVFLAATAGAVGSLAVVGAHRTAVATGQQAAVRVAEAVLDSLLAEPPVFPGGATRGPHVVRWGPEGASGARVTVTMPSGSAVVLSGRAGLPVPVLPDERTDSVTAFIAGSPP